MDDKTKIRIELEVDKELVELAAEAGLDLNVVTDHALHRALSARQLEKVPRYAARREQLRKKVQREIAWYNAHIEKHGLFADEWRRF